MERETDPQVVWIYTRATLVHQMFQLISHLKNRSSRGPIGWKSIRALAPLPVSLRVYGSLL